MVTGNGGGLGSPSNTTPVDFSHAYATCRGSADMRRYWHTSSSCGASGACDLFTPTRIESRVLVMSRRLVVGCRRCGSSGDSIVRHGRLPRCWRCAGVLAQDVRHLKGYMVCRIARMWMWARTDEDFPSFARRTTRWSDAWWVEAVVPMWDVALGMIWPRWARHLAEDGCKRTTPHQGRGISPAPRRWGDLVKQINMPSSAEAVNSLGTPWHMTKPGGWALKHILQHPSHDEDTMRPRGRVMSAEEGGVPSVSVTWDRDKA